MARDNETPGGIINQKERKRKDVTEEYKWYTRRQKIIKRRMGHLFITVTELPFVILHNIKEI